MSFSNWLSNVAPYRRLIAAMLLLAALWPMTRYVVVPCCVEVTGGTAAQEQEIAERAFYKAGCSEADPWPVFIDRDFVPPKGVQQTDGPSKNDCEDLRAQWAMAVSARRLVDLTCYQIWLALVGTVLLGGTLLYSARATKAAADAVGVSERQIEASERPWVSDDISLTSALKFDADGGRVSVKYVMENTGKTPANNVGVEAKIVPFSTMAIDEIERVTKAIRERAVRKHSLVGHTLFPGKTFTVTTSTPIERTEMVAEAERMGFPGAANAITPAIVGCAVYRSPFSERYHQTGFIIHLYRRDPAAPNAGFTISTAAGTELTLDKIRVDRSFISGYAD
jgi:hypothetical protein